MSRERFFSQAGVRDKYQGIDSLAVLLSPAKFLQGGVADEIRLIRVLILTSLKSCLRWLPLPWLANVLPFGTQRKELMGGSSLAYKKGGQKDLCPRGAPQCPVGHYYVERRQGRDADHRLLLQCPWALLPHWCSWRFLNSPLHSTDGHPSSFVVGLVTCKRNIVGVSASAHGWLWAHFLVLRAQERKYARVEPAGVSCGGVGAVTAGLLKLWGES